MDGWLGGLVCRRSVTLSLSYLWSLPDGQEVPVEQVVRVDHVGAVEEGGDDAARHALQHFALRLLRVEDDEHFARLELLLLKFGDLHVHLQQLQRQRFDGDQQACSKVLQVEAVFMEVCCALQIVTFYFKCKREAWS